MRKSTIWQVCPASSRPPATHSRPSGSTNVIISKPMIPPIGALRNETLICEGLSVHESGERVKRCRRDVAPPPSAAPSNLKPQTSNLKPQTSILKPQSPLAIDAAEGGGATS